MGLPCPMNRAGIGSRSMPHGRLPRPLPEHDCLEPELLRRTSDPYRLLGVAQDASSVEIAAAFREKRELLASDPEAVARLSEAYRILSNPQARAEHDASAR